VFSKLKQSVMLASRERKLEHFYSLFERGQTVLDVGVSTDSGPHRATNYFLKTFRYDPDTYTGLGVQDLYSVERSFPAMRFVRYPGGAFPFSDKQFDWAFSNAVIEHVGGEEAQLLFMNELMRVAHNAFFHDS
jgi:hypothetical protein